MPWDFRHINTLRARVTYKAPWAPLGAVEGERSALQYVTAAGITRPWLNHGNTEHNLREAGAQIRDEADDIHARGSTAAGVLDTSTYTTAHR